MKLKIYAIYNVDRVMGGVNSQEIYLGTFSSFDNLKKKIVVPELYLPNNVKVYSTRKVSLEKEKGYSLYKLMFFRCNGFTIGLNPWNNPELLQFFKMRDNNAVKPVVVEAKDKPEMVMGHKLENLVLKKKKKKVVEDNVPKNIPDIDEQEMVTLVEDKNKKKLR